MVGFCVEVAFEHDYVIKQKLFAHLLWSVAAVDEGVVAELALSVAAESADGVELVQYHRSITNSQDFLDISEYSYHLLRMFMVIKVSMAKLTSVTISPRENLLFIRKGQNMVLSKTDKSHFGPKVNSPELQKVYFAISLTLLPKQAHIKLTLSDQSHETIPRSPNTSKLFRKQGRMRQRFCHLSLQIDLFELTCS